MGIPGSTRWKDYERKGVVEDAWTIDALTLRREGVLKPPDNHLSRTGHLPPDLLPEGRGIDQVDYSLAYREEWALTLTGRGKGEPISWYLPLEVNPAHPGGGRVWLLCPLQTPEGMPCRRRCIKMHWPPQMRYIGCRECHNLTYRTCQRGYDDNVLAVQLVQRLEAAGLVTPEIKGFLAEIGEVEREAIRKSFYEKRKRRRPVIE